MSEEVPAADAAIPEEAEKPEETKEGDAGVAAAEDANQEAPEMPAEEAKAEDPAAKADDPASKEEATPADGTQPEAKESISERIATDPLELSILETPLPEKIDFKTLPQITRGDWEVEWRKLKQYFDQQMAIMHEEFTEKQAQYKKVEAQLQKNADFQEEHYKTIQKKLNEKYNLIQIERDAWEAEKDEIKAVMKYDSEVVTINVGGTVHLQTEKEVLCSVEGSTLQKLFSDMHELKKINEEVFLDRDGDTFKSVVNFLRNDRRVFPEFSDKNSEKLFLKEIAFWGIDKNIEYQPPNQTLKGSSLNKTQMDYSQLQNNKSRDQGRRNTSKDKLQKEDDSKIKELIAQAQGKGRLNSTLNKINEKQAEDNITQDGNQSEIIPRESYKPELAGYAQNYYAPKPKQTKKSMHPADDIDTHSQLTQMINGEANDMVKVKWAELGPLTLEEIIANSTSPVDQSLPFGISKHNKFIMGQIGADGRTQGLGKEFNNVIYEGQFKDDVYHGFGRFIYTNGNYYIGNWQMGKRSGRGKFVDMNGKTYSGLWQNSKLVGK